MVPDRPLRLGDRLDARPERSAAFYRRDRDRFGDQIKRTAEIHRRIYAEWDDLAERYRAALPEITSPEAWEETFRPWMGSDD